MITTTEILNEIINECRNGCTDAASTVQHFQRHPHLQATGVDILRVARLTKVLNFSAIREDAADLKTLINATDAQVAASKLNIYLGGMPCSKAL